jgi:hypothetical protein
MESIFLLVHHDYDDTLFYGAFLTLSDVIEYYNNNKASMAENMFAVEVVMNPSPNHAWRSRYIRLPITKE